MDDFDRSTEILSLVQDSLQVVSYKWLSRKFEITSNEAKQLLQTVVDQYSGSIDVIYAVSGWSKKRQQCYSVQLVPTSKLEEAKNLLVGNPSIHIYSIQPSAPKDSAELWSAEYIQSEELFNQPRDINNCLRDNRYSAISCISVNRKVTGSNPTDKTQPVAPKPAAIPEKYKPTNIQTVKQSDQVLNLGAQNLSKQSVQGNELKDAGTATTASEAATTAGSKKKGSGSGDNGLANLWGRASTKPKAAPIAEPPIASADDHVKACDASLEESSDDDATEFARVRRGEAKNGSKRTRRMVIDDDMTDEEQEDMDSENVISLASPEVQKTKANQSKPKKQEASTAREKRTRSSPVREESQHSPSKAFTDVVKEEGVKSEKGTSSFGPPETKKRKVLKTRIDERGREVTEVVWESDDIKSNNLTKEEKPQMEPQKAPENRSAGTTNSKAQNVSSKAGASKTSAKASGKESQGKISSFFKRKT